MKLLTTLQMGAAVAPFSQGSVAEAATLYVDRGARIVWFSPAPDQDWDWVGFSSNETTVPTPIGKVELSARCGFIAYRRIGDDRWEQFDASQNAMPASEATSPDVPFDVRLDVMVNDVQYRARWTSIATFCARRYQTDTDLQTFLHGKTWADVARDEDATIQRDLRLFRDLERRIKEKKFLIVLGGRYSGTGVFLKQFRQRYAENTVEANFDPEYFKEIRDTFKGMPARMMVSFDADAHAVCASLTLSAYAALQSQLGTDASRISGFFRLGRDLDPDRFAVAYVSEAVAEGAQPFEYLLRNVDALAKLASTGAQATRILIFLSFSRLAEWLWNPKHVNAGDVRRSIWKELKRFSQNNIDHQDQLKPTSPLNRVSSAALVLEFQKVDLPELKEAFCRACLMQIPPLNATEVDELWRKRTARSVNETVRKELMDLTGGHPFILDALVTLVGDDPLLGDSPASQLACIQTAHDRLSASVDMVTTPPGTDAQVAVQQRWQGYVRWLEANLRPATLNNGGPLLELKNPFTPIDPTSEHSDLFASGIVWLETGNGAGPLDGFAKYPDIASSSFPRIVEELVNRIQGIEGAA